MNMKEKISLITLVVAFAISLSLASLMSPAFGSTSPELAQLATTSSRPLHGTTLEIDISIEDIVNLYGLDLKLYYNTANLDLIEAVPRPPWELNLIIKNEIDDSRGMYQLAMVAVAPEPPFSGSAVLATLTFLCTDAGESAIYLADTKLADKNGNPIPHTIDGYIIRGLRIHDVAVTKIMGYPRGAYQGDPVYLDVTVENQGDFVETFTVTVYADQDTAIIGDEIIVGKQVVYDMPPRTSKILNFIWDTTDAPYGRYWISAGASVVPGEIDVEDNFLKAGEYIGGIYPPPYVRRTADMLTQIISILILASLAFAGTFHVKNYWFP